MDHSESVERLKRFDMFKDSVGAYFDSCTQGKFVMYSDAAEKICALESRVAELEGMLERASKVMVAHLNDKTAYEWTACHLADEMKAIVRDYDLSEQD